MPSKLPPPLSTWHLRPRARPRGRMPKRLLLPPQSTPEPKPLRCPISHCPRSQTHRTEAPQPPAAPATSTRSKKTCCQCFESPARMLATSLFIGPAQALRSPEKPPFLWHPSTTMEPPPLPPPKAIPLVITPPSPPLVLQLPTIPILSLSNGATWEENCYLSVVCSAVCRCYGNEEERRQ